MKYQEKKMHRRRKTGQKLLVSTSSLRLLYFVSALLSLLLPNVFSEAGAQESKLLSNDQYLEKIKALEQANQNLIQQYRIINNKNRNLNEQLKELNSANGGTSMVVTGASSSLQREAAQSLNSGVGNQVLLEVQGVDHKFVQLNGDIERLEHKIDKLTDRVDRLVGDFDVRFRPLEDGIAKLSKILETAELKPQPHGRENGTQTDLIKEMPVLSSEGVAGVSQTKKSLSLSHELTATTEAKSLGKVDDLLPGQKSLGTYTGSQASRVMTGNKQNFKVSHSTKTPGAQSGLVDQEASSQSNQNGERVIIKLPTASVTKKSASLSVLPAGTAKQQYEYAYKLLFVRDYEAAEKAFLEFTQIHPDDEYAENAFYWLAETYYVRRMYDVAFKAFNDAYNRFPSGRKAPHNLLKLGKTLTVLEDEALACEVFKAILSNYPDATTITKLAKVELGRGGCK